METAVETLVRRGASAREFPLHPLRAWIIYRSRYRTMFAPMFASLNPYVVSMVEIRL